MDKLNPFEELGVEHPTLFDITETMAPLALNWFNDPALGAAQILMNHGICEDCGYKFLGFRTTSNILWFEVANWDTVLCLDCFASRLLALKAFLGEPLWRDIVGL